MRYPNITSAVFADRPNRFVAHVKIGGEPHTVHVKNTGRCRELLLPGAEVFLCASDNPQRKTKYDMVSVRRSDGRIVNIDSQAPNAVVLEWLQGLQAAGKELPFGPVRRIVPEYTWGSSRFDFYLETLPWHAPESEMQNGPGQGLQRSSGPVYPDDTETEKWLLEVKGCTLQIGEYGYFPDAPTERGVKHLQELAKAAREGWHVAVAFVIPMEGVFEVRPNMATHPQFGEALEAARATGVQVLHLPCRVTPDSLEIDSSLNGKGLYNIEG